jgi:hypothetical protein
VWLYYRFALSFRDIEELLNCSPVGSIQIEVGDLVHIGCIESVLSASTCLGTPGGSVSTICPNNMKVLRPEGFDHRVSWPAKVRNVSRLGSEFYQ